MYIDNKLLAVALGSVLLGGGAVAAYNAVKSEPVPAPPMVSATTAASAPPAAATPDVARELAPLALAAGPHVDYAPILSVKPVTRTSAQYASVIGVEPVNRDSSQQRPREVCDDVPVTQRLPERDGNVGGTVVGAVIGGLLGNQVGRGDGRKAATVAGAAAGGYIGNRVDRNHVGGRVVQTTERQCRTVMDTVPS